MAAKIPGAGITTPLTLTEDGNLDTLTLTSTDADANFGPNLRLYRNSSSPADSDFLGTFEFEGRNDNSQDVIYVQLTSLADDVSDGTEDGSYIVSTIVGGTSRNRMAVRPTETIFNEDSVDVDFRVETDGNINGLFVDAGNSCVGIGVGNPGSFNDSGKHLVIGAGTGNGGITLYSSSTSTGHVLFADGTSGSQAYDGYISYQHANGYMNFYTGGGGHRFQIQDDGTLLGSDTSIGALSSDQRLKKDIVDHTYDIAKFKQFKPRNYAWKYPDAHVGQPTTGFVAQEVETIDNSWVSENSFQEDALATPPNLTEEKALCDGGNQKTVKLGKKDAMYISVIQQLITRIEALEG